MRHSKSDCPARMIRFGTYAAPARFEECDDLIEGFKSILKGWVVSDVTDEETHPPIITFSKRKGRFHWASDQLSPPADWTPKGPKKVMDGVADFHYRFLDWHALENPDQFCLHTAAVEINGALVIFPSTKKAGKSTLVTELALRNHRVFCDDVLPIELGSDHGIGLGILPRLRLPLAENLSPEHLAFVEARMGLADRYAAYIDFRAGELADFGETAPIRTIVILRRSTERVTARFTPVGKAEVLARMIDQNFAMHLSPTRIFDELLKIVEASDLRALEFSDVAEAAALIETELGG